MRGPFDGALQCGAVRYQCNAVLDHVERNVELG